MASDALKTGLGVVGGAGVSTALFTALPIGKILTGSEQGFSLGYPIVIFGLVSLFALIAALVVTPIQPGQRWIVLTGIAAFVLVSLAGAAVIFFEEVRSPTVRLAQHFEPSVADFRDPDGVSPIRIQLLSDSYGPARSKTAQSPFVDGYITVRSGDTVDFHLSGFSDLERKYNSKYNDFQNLRAMLTRVCSKKQNDLVCEAWNDSTVGPNQ